MLENVEEFADWGPLGTDGKPCPLRKGFTFRRWCSRCRTSATSVDMRELRRPATYGAPTTASASSSSPAATAPIAWPEPTHAKAAREALPYRTAAECIDFSLPCPSIFLTKEEGQKVNAKRPLAENTMKRIARGLMRFVVDNPTLIQTGRGERPGQAPRVPGLDKPLGVVQAEGVKHAVVAAFLAKHNGGHEATGSKLELPIATIKCRDSHALVASSLVKLKGTCRDGHALDEPIPTIQAGGNHLFEVRAFLMKYYGEGTGKGLDAPAPTITTKDRLALVTVTIAGEEYVIVDIGMRMLKPRELARATGVGDDYRLDDFLVDGEPLTQEAQVRCIGNMVCPDMAEALARANLAAARARGEQRRLPGVA
jgi:DNA (cytosine-5)-methyltransferase 1